MDLLSTLTEDQIRRLVYLLILGGVLLGYALIASRGRALSTLRSIILWLLIIVGVAAAYQLFDAARFQSAAVQSPDGRSLILRRGFDGQFHVTLDVQGANGTTYPVRFIVDTGATEMVLRQQDAQKLGFDPSRLNYLGTARTANGMTRTARVTLPQVSLEGHEARNVSALVNEGDLHASLLGMSYLARFQRIEIERDRLRIIY